jgi:ABC-type nitrate/sulfonate/bicarbonate transport system substrate-binding protein
MLPLHAALVKGLFAEEGLSVQGVRVDTRAAVEQGKSPSLWVKTDTGLTEADFGYFELSQLHTLAAGTLDYYIVDGMNFGCNQVMVAPDAPMKSAADLKGKTLALTPEWGTAFRPPPPPTYVREELKAHGLDPKDVTVTLIPWEALPKLSDYVAEGLKTGKFDAAVIAEPNPLVLREQKLARPLFTQIYQDEHNQAYCCVFVIKRAIVDRQPEKAALIVRAFRHAKQWVAQNPTKAVIAAQAAGYYTAAAPVLPSANASVSILGFDRQMDLAPMLECAFQERIDAGLIPAGKTAKELVRLHYRKIQ